MKSKLVNLVTGISATVLSIGSIAGAAYIAHHSKSINNYFYEKLPPVNESTYQNNLFAKCGKKATSILPVLMLEGGLILTAGAAMKTGIEFYSKEYKEQEKNQIDD